MAILSDGEVSTVDEILRVDSGVQEVSRAEGISIETKLGLADRDCRLKLSGFVFNQGLESRLGVVNGVPRLDRVVVSEGLKKWHGLHTLELIYSDAHHRTANGRYASKYQHFATLAQSAWEELLDTGVPCTNNPVSRGVIAELEVIEGGPVAAGSYQVAVRWVDAAGRRGELSEVKTATVATSSMIRVHPGPITGSTTGYDVYVGEGGGVLWRQNASEVGATTPYELGVVTQGGEPASSWSENVDFVLRRSKVFGRG